MNEVLLHGYIMSTLRPAGPAHRTKVPVKGAGNNATGQNKTGKPRCVAIFEKRYEHERALLHDKIESAEARLHSNRHLDVGTSDKHRNAYLTAARLKLIDLERERDRQELERLEEVGRALSACKKEFDKVIKRISSPSPPESRCGYHREIAWHFDRMLEEIEKFCEKNQKLSCKELCKFATNRYREFKTRFEAIRKRTAKEASDAARRADEESYAQEEAVWEKIKLYHEMNMIF